MKFILLSITMISVSCGTEVKAEPEQQIIIQDGEKPIIIQSVNLITKKVIGVWVANAKGII